MHIHRNVLIPILTAVLGILIGGFVATRYWIDEGLYLAELNEQLSAHQRVRALRQTRSGKAQALVEEFEIMLDGDIVGLGYSAENSTVNKEAARNILRRVASYRKEFPHTPSDPLTAKAVEHALTLASQ